MGLKLIPSDMCRPRAHKNVDYYIDSDLDFKEELFFVENEDAIKEHLRKEQIKQKPRQIEAQAAQPKPKSRPKNPQNQDVPPSNFHMIIQKPEYANIVGMKKERVNPCRSVDHTNIHENEYRIAEGAFYRNLRNTHA